MSPSYPKKQPSAARESARDYLAALEAGDPAGATQALNEAAAAGYDTSHMVAMGNRLKETREHLEQNPRHFLSTTDEVPVAGRESLEMKLPDVQTASSRPLQ